MIFQSVAKKQPNKLVQGGPKKNGAPNQAQDGAEKPKGRFQKIIDYTKPREGTEANFAKTDMIQSCSNAAIEGFYMLGPTGAAANVAATFAGNKLAFNSNKYVGALGGAAAGAAITAGLGAALGTGPNYTMIAANSVVGAFSVLRGDKMAIFRDAGAFGIFFAIPFSGGAKAGIGLASTLAAEVKHEGKRALLASALGAATGVATSMAGHGGMANAIATAINSTPWGAGFDPTVTKLAVAGILGGVCATLGAVGGPRIGQAMRNAEQDAGNKLSEEQKQQQNKKPGRLGVTGNQIKGSLVGALVRQGINAAALGKIDISNLTGSAVNIATGIGIDAGMGIYQKYLINKTIGDKPDDPKNPGDPQQPPQAPPESGKAEFKPVPPKLSA